MAVVIKEVGYVMVHVPDFVRYGSKPIRDISEDESLLDRIRDHLLEYDQVLRYPPNQVFIGNMKPDDLNSVSKPWYEHPLKDALRQGPFGEIMPEDEFYGWLKAADDFDLLWLDQDFLHEIRERSQKSAISS